jgi:superfamily II helicase
VGYLIYLYIFNIWLAPHSSKNITLILENTSLGVMALRICHTCGKTAHSENALEFFSKCNRHKYGRKNLCKECDNEARRSRDRSEYLKIYQEKNKERIKRYRDKYYQMVSQTARYNLQHVWKNMTGRCYNPKHASYHNYGARGITVCNEWRNNKEGFIQWGTENGWQKGLQIDRIDNEGHYNPDNCQFITKKQQARNTRRTTTNYINLTRICSNCKTEKPLKQFRNDKTKNLGKTYMCKQCAREKDRQKRRRTQPLPPAYPRH